MSDTNWQADALCNHIDNPEIFYPERLTGQNHAAEAKKICHSCEVQIQCLRYALETDQRFGIWGGTSEHDRRSLRRQLRGAA